MIRALTSAWLIAKWLYRGCGCGILLGIILSIMTACNQSSLPAHSDQSSPTAALIPTLKPPDTDELVSPMCAHVDTIEVIVIINIDMPTPRCINVQPDQYLSVSNHISQTVQVQVAGFDQQIAPNESATFAKPFGQYLAPGIHFVWMSNYGGNAVELWLTPTKQYILNK